MKKVFSLLRKTLAFVIILVAMVWLFLNSTYFQTRLAKKAAYILTDQTGIEISIGRLSLGLPFNVTAHEIELASNGERFAFVNEARIDFSYNDFLNHSLFRIVAIEASNVTLESIPSKEIFNINSSSNSKGIESITVNYLVFGPKVLNSLNISQHLLPGPLNLKGSIQKNGTLFFSFNNDSGNIKKFDGHFYLSPEGKINRSFLNLSTNELPQFSPFQGPISAHLKFTGTINQPQISITFDSREISHSQLHFTNVEGSVDCIIDTDQINGSLTLDSDTLKIGTQFAFPKTAPIELKQLYLDSPFGSVTGDLSIFENEQWAEGHLEGTIVNVDFLKTWLPDLSQGNLNFSLKLSSSPTPSASLELKASNLVSKKFSIDTLNFQAIVPNLQGDSPVHFKLDSKHSNLNIEAIGMEGSFDKEGLLRGQIVIPYLYPIEYSVNLPLTYSLMPFKYSVDEQKPLEGFLSTKGEIITFLQFFFDDSILLSGLAEANVKLAGTLYDPKINGECRIVNGSFEIPEIGTMLRNVNARFESNGTHIILSELHAKDRSGGILTGKGEADLLDGLPFKIDMFLDNILILNQDYAMAIVKGDLTLKGNKSGGTLKGTLQSTSAKIAIPEQTPSLMNHVEVTYINLPPNTRPPQALPKRDSSWPLAMDIGITIPKNLTITGHDLASEWKGDFSIQGTAKNPLFDGEVKVVNGSYLFNGKPFEINQGTITLAGELEKKTSLYVIASKDLGKIRADAILKGPIKNPTVTFRSNPPLPQREIISWILFDRGTSEISTFEGSQLTESISNLDSNHQGPDVLTKLRTALGIDRLDISRNPNASDNGVNLQLGKYISKGVLISISKSDVNRLAIEAALTPRIKMQAQVGDDSEGQVLIKWKRDY